MSHSISFYSNWTVHFNGGFDGDVEFVAPDGTKHAIPFHAVEAVVAEKIKRDRISTLENMDPRDLLK
jgi:hypothetical protein